MVDPTHFDKRQRCRGSRYRILGIALILMVGICSIIVNVDNLFAQTDTTLRPRQPDTIIVQFVPGQSEDEFRESINQLGMTVDRIWSEFGLAVIRPSLEQRSVRASSLSAQQASMNALLSLPGILAAEMDATVYAADVLGDVDPIGNGYVQSTLFDTPPTDNLLDAQWAFQQLGVWEAWTVGRGNPDLIVAVIDSGFNIEHEDIGTESLWSNVAEINGMPEVDDDQNGFIDDVHGWDWVENDAQTNDRYGHGTHVSGTIDAITNNETGIVGLGGNLQMLPLRVLDENGAGQLSDLIDAIYYAYRSGARIINLSLVLQFDSPALFEAIRVAHDHNIVLVAASGNLSTAVSWPARYDETIAVAATDRNDVRGMFSNFGPEIDLAAPGVDILSTHLDSEYVYQSGTSMAAAHVTALASLLLSVRPDLDNDQVRALMQTTAHDANRQTAPDFDEELGAGRIDFASAMKMASTELDLQIESPPTAGLYAGEVLTMTVRVGADASEDIPVHGAVVGYDLFSDDETANQSETSITDSSGNAEIVLMLPRQPGKYIWRAVVGNADLELQMDVEARTAAVEIVLPTEGVSVDESSVELRIQILDVDGQVAKRSTTLHLETDLGRFDNDLQQISLSVVDGSYVVTFYPDKIAGTATLTTQVNGSIDFYYLSVLPGQADAIISEQTPSPIMNGVTNGETEVELAIRDSHGNAVVDGTAVYVVAQGGEVAEYYLSSVEGSVTTTLRVPHGVDGPVRLQAVVPDTTAELKLDFPLLNRTTLLPFVVAD